VRVSTKARIEEESAVEADIAPAEVNNGSCVANLQVLVDANVAAERQLTLTGTSVLVEGQLVQPPEGKNQKVELLMENIPHVGTVNAAKYPIAKAKLSLESLRSQLHLRARTNTISCVVRIRHALAVAMHTFFDKNGFMWMHTPIITTSYYEGAGEMFQVMTLFSEAEEEKDAEFAHEDYTLAVTELQIGVKLKRAAGLKQEVAGLGEDLPAVGTEAP
jgi:asparaginyl-tRNA synthetase